MQGHSGGAVTGRTRTGLVGLEPQALRTRVGVSQGVGHPCRHFGTINGTERTKRRVGGCVSRNAQVVHLHNGVVALEGNCTSINVGVVPVGGVAAVGGYAQQSGTRGNNGATGTGCRCDLVEHALNKHGHLLTGDVVSRRVGGGRRAIGDTQLLELVDGRLDLG